MQGVTGEAELQHSSLQESLGWQLSSGVSCKGTHRDGRGQAGDGSSASLHQARQGWVGELGPVLVLEQRSHSQLPGWGCCTLSPAAMLLLQVPGGCMGLGLPWLLALMDTESPGPGHRV